MRPALPRNPHPPNPSSDMNGYVSPWMDQDLSIFRNAAARFLEAEMVPNEEQWRKQQHVGKDIWRKAGAMGFLCTDVPAEYDGAGGDFPLAAPFPRHAVTAANSRTGF